MLFKIYRKEMVDSFRDRRTLLLTVFLPILMMTALIFFYEGIISSHEDEIYTLAVESTISNEQELLLKSMANVELLKSESPEQELLDGHAHSALIFADDFDESIQSGGIGNVEMIGDSLSQKSSSLMYRVQGKLAEFEQIVVVERLQEANIDPAITKAVAFEQKEMNEENSNIMALAILIPMLLTLAIGVGAGPSAADLFAGEKERKTMEALLMTPVNRTKLLFAKFLTITSVGMIIGFITLIVVAIEIAFFTEHLKAAISFDGNIAVILAVGILVIVIYSCFVASILTVTSIIGKTVKEAQSYSMPVMMLLVFPGLMLMGLGVHEYTMTHFLMPFVNVFTVITELIFGIIDYSHLLAMALSNIAIVVILLTVSRILFLKDKWVLD